MAVTNRYVTIKHYLEGVPKETDFEINTTDVSLSLKPGSSDVLVKNLYVSIDPYHYNRMKVYSPSQMDGFSQRLALGQVIEAFGIGRVLTSDNPSFEKDDLVAGVIGWEEYSLVRGGFMLRKLDKIDFPLSYHVGILGLSGLTAYAGFYNVCKPKTGDKVFVSAASGSVGHLVGQFAKLFGCYVVGCAGSKQKVDLLKDKLGFDDAFNYKEEPHLGSTLKRYFPDGIDIYFDNVGGEMLEAAVRNMKMFGKIAVCGVISEYANTKKRAAPEMLDIVYKRISIQGFLVGDYLHVFPEFISTTLDYLRDGKLHVLEDVSQGVDSIPSAMAGVFRGDNIGKKIVQVAEN